MIDYIWHIPRNQIVHVSSTVNGIIRGRSEAQDYAVSLMMRGAAHRIVTKLLKDGLLTFERQHDPKTGTMKLTAIAAVIAPGTETADLRNEIREAVAAERQRIIDIVEVMAVRHGNKGFLETLAAIRSPEVPR